MANNTINKEEIEEFNNIARNGGIQMENLSHYINLIYKIEYIKKSIIETFNIKNKKKPFWNLEILDIGCGGGLLTEPMSRLGGKLTGIDASKKKYLQKFMRKNNLK